jgi:GNAT superfamily N-acetyltransferase
MADTRLITEADIPAAMRLKEAAGWNQTEADWRNVMRLAPDGCFGIDAGGALAATATAVCYGQELAWIGMVLTHPEHRGKGYARALMERALEHLDARGVTWIKLDATDMGRPLYARLEFTDECAIERWGRPEGETPKPFTLPPWRRSEWRELDRAAFGADRSALLEVLAPLGSASIPGEGYGMGRAGTRAAYFGPCVSRTPEAARQLLRWFLAQHPGEAVYWDLLPGNAAAAELAGEFGFAPLRRLMRMARPGHPGAGFIRNDCHTFAIAGFEYG